MKSSIRLLLIIALLVCTSSIRAQDESDYKYSKNTLDIGALGNKGFAFIGYNRSIFQYNKLEILLGPSIGYVPSAREDTANSVPRYLHLIFGTNVTYTIFSYLKIIGGVSYSKILLGDPYHTKTKSNYDRILGDFGVIIQFKKSDFGLKLSYNPILFDNGADDIQGFPYGLTFRINL